MLIFLVLLIAVVAIAVFIWNYRRQAAAREAASAERMKAFLDAARTTTPQGQAPAAPHVPHAQPAAQPAGATAWPQPEVSGGSARAAFMSAQHAACYAVLKSALPEYAVFARVSLAAFITPADNLAGFAREAQERRLAEAVVDFLVCDKAFKSIAAVQCDAKNGKAAGAAAFAAACVQSSGLRWVEVESQSVPAGADLRRRVLGA